MATSPSFLRGLTLRLLHNPAPPAIDAWLAQTAALGANLAAVVPHHYVTLGPGTPNLAAPPAGQHIPWFIWPDLGQDPAHPFGNTPSPDLVYYACKAAADRGLHVLLKPHIDSYEGGWRGDISVTGLAGDWAWGYRHRFLQRYVDIAKEVNGVILCLGCELVQATKELGAPFWIDVAAWVRAQGFTGPLTYAANWGNNSDAEFLLLADLWPHLDYLGVDAYFPLVGDTDPPSPNLATLVAGWHRKPFSWMPPTDELLLGASKAAGKPLLFTELGYGNYSGTAARPFRDTQPGDMRDDALQARCWQAARQVWSAQPACAGFAAWEGWLGAPLELSHNILGRPAGAVALGP